MMAKRKHCQKCDFPESTCICAATRKINNQIHFDIMQHTAEAKAAKNTIKLCRLCLKNITVWRGENEDDFSALRQQLESEIDHCWLIYPTEKSQDIDLASRNFVRPKRLVIIDGTWRKAYKIFRLNPWLENLMSVQLIKLQGNYQIRKAPKPGQLSSLECVLELLHKLEPETNTQALENCFSLFKSHYLKHKIGK